MESDPLDDIEKFVRMARDRGAEMKAFEGLLTEIGASLADIVQHMEKPKEQHMPPDFSGIVGAIERLKIQATVTPTFNVPPAPAPEVRFMPAADWQEMRISIEQPFGQPPKVATITKTK